MSPAGLPLDGLAVLNGRTFLGAGLAGDIAWFQFGPSRASISPAGQDRITGDYALHVSCSWEWESAPGVAIASDGSSLEAISKLGEGSPHLTSVVGVDSSTLILLFASGARLVLYLDPTSASEQARLLRPGLLGPHLVLYGGSHEWHEV